MKYALVKVSTNRWVVARQSQVIEGEFRTLTKPMPESIARKVYDDLRILGYVVCDKAFEVRYLIGV